MARGTQKQEQTAEVGADFPYGALLNHPAWPVIDRSLAELESNDDLELQTARRYVIGYLLQQLVAKDLVPPSLAGGPTPVGGRKASRWKWVLQLETSAATNPKKRATTGVQRAVS